MIDIFCLSLCRSSALYVYDTETGAYAQVAECAYTSGLHPELTSFTVFGDSFVVLNLVMTDGNTDNHQKSHLILPIEEIHSLIQHEDSKLISAESSI